ncbi:MAG: EAL domain-containing protein [Deltaproteobacteria bacterium]|nr:EAL domain-containing protein [Deltaproteobacteria bacterium]
MALSVLPLLRVSSRPPLGMDTDGVQLEGPALLADDGQAVDALVMDPEAGTRRLLARALASRGFAVTVTASAEEARRLLRGKTFPLVLVGWGDPGDPSGEALCRALRGPLVSREAVVIMVAHRNDGAEIQRALDLGVDDYIVLPSLGHQLETRLRVITRRVQRLASRLRSEDALRTALDRDEFRLVYQPIVALSGGKRVGYEALVRWQHPTRGELSPAEFLPLCEASGLVVPLGTRVLELAVRQLSTWQRLGHPMDFFVAVNVSALQLAAPDFVQNVLELGRASGLRPRQLKLEVTETSLVSDPEEAAGKLARLRVAGFSLGIDDFGTGYSSLSYLHRFKADTLKIDRSFVGALEADEGAVSIVRAIIAVGHSLGMKLVAEGVETVPQRDTLQRLGCDYGQGYLFSRPVSPSRAP